MAIKKARTAFTIDKDVLKQFVDISKEKAINMSGLVNILLKKWLEENK